MRIIIICGLIPLVGFVVWSLPNWNEPTENQKHYLHDGREFNKQQIEHLLARFSEKSIPEVVVTNGKILVPSSYRNLCNEIAGSAEFTQLGTKNKSSDNFTNPFLSSSDKERNAKQKKLNQLEDILRRISGIRDAIVLHDQSKSSDFNRKILQTGTVTLWSKEGEVISPLHASTARHIVCNAFAGLDKSNVLVVDGDTGMILDSLTNSDGPSPSIASQLDLESTRKQLEVEARKLLAKYGDPDVKVRMDLEKREIQLKEKTQPTKSPRQNPTERSKVVANGTGSIRSNPPANPPTNPQKEKNKTVLIKRLLGIEVSIPKDSVSHYIHQHLGTTAEITDDQFARGIVSIRNEITKELVRWLRSQKGIDGSSDLVAVFVSRSTEDLVSNQDGNESNISSAWTNYTVPGAAGAGLLFAITLLVMSVKSKRQKASGPPRGQPSDGGRAFVNRNQKHAGRELAEEANEVIQTTPENSARAFQSLVAGDPN